MNNPEPTISALTPEQADAARRAMAEISGRGASEPRGPQVVDGQVEAHHPVEPGTNRRHTWAEFQEAGMLWVVNRILHLFGWTIVLVIDDETDELRGAHPARTEWRGFPREREELGYTRVSEWMAKAGAAVLEETKR